MSHNGCARPLIAVPSHWARNQGLGASFFGERNGRFPFSVALGARHPAGRV